jgi:hypothetical protein
MKLKDFIEKLEEYDPDLEVTLILDGCYSTIGENTKYIVNEKPGIIYIVEKNNENTETT